MAARATPDEKAAASSSERAQRLVTRSRIGRKQKDRSTGIGPSQLRLLFRHGGGGVCGERPRLPLVVLSSDAISADAGYCSPR
jgi:hypothetical protein